jgi:hypothetical protein
MFQSITDKDINYIPGEKQVFIPLLHQQEENKV